MDAILKRLFELQDLEYKDFTSKLIPNVGKEKFIGIRLPALKAYAKELTKNCGYEDFLKELPHNYIEEYFLHAFIIGNLKDFSKIIDYLNVFLPYVDNWAVCDTCIPKVFAKHREELYPILVKWLQSKHLYTRRYAIRMLMGFYLDEGFKTEHLDLVASVKTDEYYLQMMVAWYFATALAKQYDSAIKVIESKVLDPWIQNKTIQKAKESFRVSDAHKEYLSRLKV